MFGGPDRALLEVDAAAVVKTARATSIDGEALEPHESEQPGPWPA